MKIWFSLIICLIIIVSGCVKDETLVNKVIGEYSGVLNDKNDVSNTGYLISVTGGINNLDFNAVEIDEFPSFSSIPVVENSTEIACYSKEEDLIKKHAHFIFRGERITLTIFIINESLGDTILYAGLKQ